MTPDTLVRRIRTILKEVDLSGFPIKFLLEVTRGSALAPDENRRPAALIQTRFQSVNVQTRKPFYLRHAEAVFPHTVKGFARSSSLFKIYVLTTVRRMLVEMLHHELDEFFSVKGHRPFNPHPHSVALHPDVKTLLKRFRKPPQRKGPRRRTGGALSD